jgi:hypothetical protein
MLFRFVQGELDVVVSSTRHCDALATAVTGQAMIPDYLSNIRQDECTVGAIAERYVACCLDLTRVYDMA